MVQRSNAMLGPGPPEKIQPKGPMSVFPGCQDPSRWLRMGLKRGASPIPWLLLGDLVTEKFCSVALVADSRRYIAFTPVVKESLLAQIRDHVSGKLVVSQSLPP